MNNPKPIDIPDSRIIEGMRRVTLGAPPGMEDNCRPLEMLRDDTNHEYWVLCKWEDKEFWFIILGDMFPPISFAPVEGQPYAV